MSIELSNAGLGATIAVTAIDECGEQKPGHVAAERALTIYLDRREIVTVMTLGTQPELLTLGWLRNQRLVESLQDVKSILVNWETDSWTLGISLRIYCWLPWRRVWSNGSSRNSIHVSSDLDQRSDQSDPSGVFCDIECYYRSLPGT